MGDLLTQWLAHYDPIHRGWTTRGIANGLCATCGFFFPRIRGGCNLYRGEGSAAAIDYTDVVGACGADELSISNFAWRGHQADRAYLYALKAIGGGGVETDAGQHVRRVEINSAGGYRGPLPNRPANLAARVLAGGVFELRWTYNPELEETPPASFRLYKGEDGQPVNYGAVVAAVAYRAGRHHFQHVSAAFPHGRLVTWAVRAVSTGGLEDSNMATATARADAAAPAVTCRVLSEGGPETSEPGEP